jgi:hypothetical protein
MLAQQLRSYEMEIEDARNGSSFDRADVTAGSILDNALKESRKTSVLYQQHLEEFHKSAIRIRAAFPSVSVADLPGNQIPMAEQLMHTAPFWPDDLSGLSHQDVLNFMADNRAWNKRLREGTATLVNTRLAKTITQEEYALRRNRANQDAAECQRRAGMLVRDIAIRKLDRSR